MIRNYLKVAFRNLTKHKFYSAINILGLSVGIASVLLMALYVQYELSYDKHVPDADRIYRITMQASLSGQDIEAATATPHLAPTLLEEFPEVEAYARFRDHGSYIVAYEDTKIREEGIIFADQGAADMFDFDFVIGDPATALAEPNTLVLTEETAKKYFGDEDPMGKTLLLDNEWEYSVSGVIKELPKNMHFQFDIFCSMESLDGAKNDLWVSNNFNSYVKLREGTSPEQVTEKAQLLIDKYIGVEIEKFIGKSLDEWAEEGNQMRYNLTPLVGLHLDSHVDGELAVNGDRQYVLIFGIIALFILVIACINFMNLATARSASRAKEVGIRKTLGSIKKQLVTQFLSEAFIMSLIAFAIGLVLAGFCLPMFNQLADRSLSIEDINWPTFLPILIGIALFIGLFAGSYPAFYLSAFKPAAVLKGKLQGGMKHKGIRSALVVFQFACSITLIVCTLVVYQQMQYIQNQNLGYDKDQLVYVQNAYMLEDNVENYKQELLRHPGVLNATISGSLPTPSNRNSTYYFPGSNPDDPRSTSLDIWHVDFDYLQTIGIEITEGRAFDSQFRTDSTAIVINESCAKQFQWTPEEAIGQTVGTLDSQGNEYYEVVGVVKDFFFESMRQEIRPLILHIGRSHGLVTFRIQPEQTQQVIAAMEQTWMTMSNGQPFSYEFVDDKFNGVYENERRQGTIFTVFAGLAILIACLGLFGLAAFTAEQRTKEIGVRKVLGATVPSLVVLLSREFMILVGVAFIVASAISAFLMNAWLSDFSYHTKLAPWIFIVAGITAMAIAWFTMSFQSLRAALANPVKSLRSE